MSIFAIAALVLGGMFTLAITVTAALSWSWHTQSDSSFKNRLTRMVAIADIVQPIMLVATIAMTIFYITQSAHYYGLALACGMFMVVFGVSLLLILPLQKRIAATSSGNTAVLHSLRQQWMRLHAGRTAASCAAYALLFFSV